MNKKLIVLLLLLSFPACSLFSSPKGTVKAYIAAAEKKDVEKMNSLFSKKAIDQLGLENIKENNSFFVDTTQNSSNPYHMEQMAETSIPGGGQRVIFVYKSVSSSSTLAFDLSKENGLWKIDAINSPDVPGVEPMISVPAIPSPETVVPPKDPGQVGPGKIISGGVLNGKAINLPKPAYPPIARAAKASGTVVVQVLVDEKGNVIEASPISGHPLLQAAAVAAARQATFTPTKLSGQVVRVKGVITYQFTPE